MLPIFALLFHVSFSNMTLPKNHIPYSNLFLKIVLSDFILLAHV